MVGKEEFYKVISKFKSGNKRNYDYLVKAGKAKVSRKTLSNSAKKCLKRKNSLTNREKQHYICYSKEEKVQIKINSPITGSYISNSRNLACPRHWW